MVDREKLFQQLSNGYVLNQVDVKPQRSELEGLASRGSGSVKELARTYLDLSLQSQYLRAMQIPAEFQQTLFNLAALNYLMVSMNEKPSESELQKARSLIRQRGKEYEKALNSPTKPLLSEIELLHLAKQMQEDQLQLMRKVSSLAKQDAAPAGKTDRNAIRTTVYSNKQKNRVLTQLINRSGKDLHNCLILIELIPGDETSKMPLLPLFTRGALKEEAEGTRKALDYSKELSKAWFEAENMPRVFPLYITEWPKGGNVIFELGQPHIVRHATSATMSIWSKELSCEQTSLGIHQYLLEWEVEKTAMSSLSLPPDQPGKPGLSTYASNRRDAQSKRNLDAFKAGARWKGNETIRYSRDPSRMLDMEKRKKPPQTRDTFAIELKIEEVEANRIKGRMTIDQRTYEVAGTFAGTEVVMITERKGDYQHTVRGTVDNKGSFSFRCYGRTSEGFHSSGNGVLTKQ